MKVEKRTVSVRMKETVVKWLEKRAAKNNRDVSKEVNAILENIKENEK